MTATTLVNDVEVDAADGAAAVELEHRLWYLTPTTVGRGQDWIVEIPGPVDSDEVEAVVRTWLGDLGQRSTTVRFDGNVHHVASHHGAGPMRPRSHLDFIG